MYLGTIVLTWTPTRSAAGLILPLQGSCLAHRSPAGVLRTGHGQHGGVGPVQPGCQGLGPL